MAEAQGIITQGLTPEYLAFYYIQQLTQMPEGSVIYLPTEGGIPLFSQPWHRPVDAGHVPMTEAGNHGS